MAKRFLNVFNPKSFITAYCKYNEKKSQCAVIDNRNA